MSEFLDPSSNLCRKAFPEVLNIEKYIIDQYIKRLANRELRTHLSINTPSTVNAMLETAIKYKYVFFKNRREYGNNIPNKPS